MPTGMCVPACVYSSQSPLGPSRLGTVTHRTPPLPVSHAPSVAPKELSCFSTACGQGCAAEYLRKPHWGHPEVRKPPGTQCPPPHLIPDLFLSLQSPSPKSRSHQGKELGGRGHDWHLSRCHSLKAPPTSIVHASAEGHPVPSTLPWLSLLVFASTSVGKNNLSLLDP